MNNDKFIRNFYISGCLITEREYYFYIFHVSKYSIIKLTGVVEYLLHEDFIQKKNLFFETDKRNDKKYLKIKKDGKN